MIKKGTVSRRSFLSIVTGGAITIGAAGTVMGGAAYARQVTDSDTGSNADPVGRGRSSVTDSDSGSNADRAGYGRGSGGRSGLTDSDTGNNSDPVGRGRGSADRAGAGRRCSDSDSGGRADPGGSGRRCTDSDGR